MGSLSGYTCCIEYGGKWVESSSISISGHASTCFIRGKTDTIAHFEHGSYGVVDFKTSATRPQNIPIYSRQLHAYAYCPEHPGPGKLSLAPITQIGLLCVEPQEVLDVKGGYAYAGKADWMECPRDDEAFLSFIGEVLSVLDLPEPPEPGKDCTWRNYREGARRSGW